MVNMSLTCSVHVSSFTTVHYYFVLASLSQSEDPKWSCLKTQLWLPPPVIEPPKWMSLKLFYNFVAKNRTDGTKSCYWSPVIWEGSRHTERLSASSSLSPPAIQIDGATELLLKIQQAQIWPTAVTRPSGHPERCTGEFRTSTNSASSKRSNPLPSGPGLNNSILHIRDCNLDSPSNKDNFPIRTNLPF